MNVIPSEVAKQDSELFDIESIITHRFKGNKKTLSNLQLYIKFEDESNPEWREWDATYGGHEKVHEYFRNNNMTSYIPIKYTYPKSHPLYEAKRTTNRPCRKRQKRDGSFSGVTT